MKSKQLKLARREEQKRNKIMSPKIRKIITAICITILCIAAALFSVDLLRAKKNNQPPLFCCPVIEYDNGSTDYYGLFYKVWKDYDPFEDETRYYVGFWFVPKNFSI
ncbi:MAG: hypothetical protein K2J11_08455 [Oscillospiraceae bacterium]|nr:hypothetical protein [Oscillospiraceae bacterium]